MIKKKQYRRIAAVFLAALLLLAAATVIVGNYFLSVSLVRQESFNEAIEPEGAVSGEDQEIINASRAAYDRFRDQVLANPSITKETVEIRSGDGLRLEADRYTQGGEKAHDWVIFVHGYVSSRLAESSQNIVSVYLNEGYQVLSPDNRAHGGSEGAYIGMGWLDRLDIVQWVNYLTEQDPEAKIVLHGVSMGAAAVMMTSGEDLPAQVKAIVEDCGYSSVWDEFESELSYMYHLPAFPALYMADVMAGIRAGYHFKEASSVRQLAKSRLPVLFIHGDKDRFVPFEMVYRNYEACPHPDKELLVVNGAGHVESYLREPETYWNTVFSFLTPLLFS